MVEMITAGETTVAIIIRADYSVSGLKFFTPPEFSQQLGIMGHPAGKVIEPHIHCPVSRHVVQTQEVLIIRKGVLRANFYNCDKKYISSTELRAGDVILLAAGGHGFEVIEDAEFVEVKQGPYSPKCDKERFTPEAPECGEGHG